MSVLGDPKVRCRMKICKNIKMKIIIGTTVILSFGLLSACQGNDVNSVEDSKSLSSDGLTLVTTLPAPSNTRDGADQLIAKNDVLEIDVFQVDQLDKTVQVDSNGRISMPLIGPITAANKTVSGLEHELENHYGAKYVQSPDISVFVKESMGQRITLNGEFKSPGIYPTTADATLLQAISQGGGITKISDERKIYVFRQFNDKRLVANYNLKDIRAGKSQDPTVYGGDVIVAFSSSTKVAAENLRQALGAAVSVSSITRYGL